MRAVLPLLLLASSAPAQQSVFAEGFDDGSNVGGWAWGTGNEAISPVNGNPGAYLQDLTLFSCCPTLSTEAGASSVFTGDYRAKGVTTVGCDLITLDTDFGFGFRPLTVMLVNDGGTPGNPGDDWGAYFVGEKEIPDPGTPIFASTPAGWASYDFAIPSQADAPPPGWTPFGGGAHTWSELVQDVDALRFYYGDPELLYLFLSWDVGLDNPRIDFADCDGNGAPDSEDVAAPAGDLDGDGTPDACQPLSADVASLSTAAGGAQTLSLHAGPAHAGALHVLGGSLSGTRPGLLVGGALVPLNLDAYLLLSIDPGASPVAGGVGTLDAEGAATATFVLPPGLPALAGATVHHAYVALDPVSGAIELVSNALPCALLP